MAFSITKINGCVIGAPQLKVYNAKGELKICVPPGPPPAPVVWGSITGLVTNQTDLINYLGLNFYPLNSNPAGYVPDTRTLTINGTSYDLSADRSWTIPAGGTVTSVELAAGTGISLSGTNPITTFGTITVTNDAPDQVVVLTAGTGIDITGTYPSFTIDNTAPGVTYTVDNGLESQTTPTPDPNNFQLGGPLVRDTVIGGAARTYGIDFSELLYITGTTDQLNVIADNGVDNTQLDISGTSGQIVHTNTVAGSQSAVLIQSSTAALQQISATSGGSIQFTSNFGLFGYYHTPVATQVQYHVEINPVGIHIVTPDVQALTATVGQVLTLQNATTGEVEFQDGGGIYTVDNGLTETPAGNFQLGGTLLADTGISGDANQFSLTFDDMYVIGGTASFKTSFTVDDGTTTSSIALQAAIASIGCGVNGSGSSSFAEFTDTQSRLGYLTSTQTVQFGADGTGLYVRTPTVAATTATVGQVLTLQNATTGQVEFQTPGTTTGDSLSPLLLMGG